MMLCPVPLPRRARHELFRAIWDKKSDPPYLPRLLGDILAGKVSIFHLSLHGSSTSEPALAPPAIPDSRPSSMLLLPPQLGFYCRSFSRLGNSPCCFSKRLILAFWLKHTTHFSAAMKINVNKSSTVIPRGQE